MDVLQFLSARGVSRSELRDFLLNELTPGDNDVVFLGGSLAEGIGTPYSDVDVFFVSHLPDQGRRAQGDRTLEFQGMSLDVEIKSRSYVEALIFDLNTQQITDSRSAFSIFRNELEFANRLRFGMPLFGGGRLLQWQNAMPWKRLAERLKRRALVEADSLHCDLCGFLADGDPESAVLICNRLVTAVAQYAIFRVGRTAIADKWALRILRDEARQRSEYQTLSVALHELIAWTGRENDRELPAIASAANLLLFLLQVFGAGRIGSALLADLTQLVRRALHDRLLGRALFRDVAIRYDDNQNCTIRSWRTGLELVGNWRTGLAGLLIETGSSLDEIRRVFQDSGSNDGLSQAIGDLRVVLRACEFGRV